MNIARAHARLRPFISTFPRPLRYLSDYKTPPASTPSDEEVRRATQYCTKLL
ncbi:MAG: hypothetical protein Q9222_004089, partial [Ikaeria aurantiellina]